MQTIQTNLNTKASTQFTNFNFNSMCMFKGVALGAGPEGLAKVCCGDSDDGGEIAALIKSGSFDLGMENKKRFRFFYFGVDTAGPLLLKVYGDGELAAEYTAPEGKSGMQNIRVPISRMQKARYWDWQIENIDGSFFALYSVKALPVIAHPGRNSY